MSEGVKKGITSGVLFGLSQFFLFLIFGLIFYLGVVFKISNNLPLDDVFTAIYGILFSGIIAGNNMNFLPDVGASKRAAASIFYIQDSKD